MTVTAEEFLRRFLLHVLPTGFGRIRFFGFLANRRRKSLLPLCRHLLQIVTRDSHDSVQHKTCSAALAVPSLWHLDALDAALHRYETQLAFGETEDCFDSS